MVRINKEIDIEKRYRFPDNIKVIRYKGNVIIVSSETGNWIVLKNDNQLDFFESLKSLTIKDAMSGFKGRKDDVREVITQIEAKQFDDLAVNKITSKRLHLYLTNACNLRCLHCYMFAGEKNEKELSTEDVFSLLEKFKQYGGEAVTFSGGEICMRPDLFPIIKHANELQLKVQLMTNGTLWTDELISKIAPLVSNVQISIDGYSEEENAMIRGKGNFCKALDTCDKFVKCCKSVQVAITPLFTEETEEKSTEYATFGRMLWEKYKDYSFKVIFSNELLDGREVSLSVDQKLKYKQYIDLIYKKCFGNVSDISFAESRKRKEIMDSCSFGSLTVSSNGDVYFCGRIPFLGKVANVRSDSFQRIMNLSEKAIQCTNVNNLKPCNHCELKYICGGGCRIDYFPKLTSCTDIENLNMDDIPPRQCSEKVKHEFYDLMLRTNEMIYQ